MAAATPSPLAASTETKNGVKLRRLLVDGGTSVLRKVFDGIHPAKKLAANLNLNNSTLDDLFARGILNEQQRNRLFPPDGSNPDSKTFDITLLFLLLTEICGLSPPVRTGWNHKPQAKNKSLEANLVRIKLFRNKLIHTPETRIQTVMFNDLWKEISGVLVSLGLDQTKVERLRAERCGEEDYLDVLFKWADREREIKSKLEEVRQGQGKMQKTQQDNQELLQDIKIAVEAACKTQQEHLTLLQGENAKLEQAHETQQGTESKLETIHQSQASTQETVERVHCTQLEDHETLQDSKSKLEVVYETHTKTQETVERVRQTQLKDCETLQDNKSKLNELHLTQSNTQETVKKVRQTQLEDRETLEDNKSKMDEVHQTLTKTRETVDEVRQTQLENRETFQDSKLKLDEVHQTEIKTQQVVKGVAKTQKEHSETLQAVKQAVNSLKEEREADSKQGQILKNLAKSEFKGDIEYYVGRYQEGTREWVFNEVEKWLDDRRSQNRVMVISANAGMGKSVISAVICKRMQEAGKLAGSHFCQHNNARYRNPQLMLQSLACHLSHALPEYRQALVKQLSRNLGKDLTNMGVEELFALLFKEPLNTVADPGRNMLMVIDGLDESEYQERNELLDVIGNHLSKLPCWIRFLCTTRPERNIAEALRHLKPFQLESNDDKNMEDMKRFIENRTQHLIVPEKKDAIAEKLVEKSEGLMLYAYFLVSYIEENKSVVDQEDLDDNLPLAISSAYHSYFRRLERELKKELGVNEENFLNLFSAVISSREPLPIDFVFKLLGSNSSSPLARRKVLKAISSVSSLLPIRDGCLHVIHKSVKDWLTDASCYGEHDFTMDEKEGHRILANLCADELDHLKQKGVHDAQFSSTETYALHHGTRHMLQLDEKMRSRSLEECVQRYVTDLDLLYAKVCVNSSMAAEEILWLQSQELSRALCVDSKDSLNFLMVLLRKYFNTISDHPHIVFQTLLNEGGPVLSPMASEMLQEKYPEIPYMEFVNKDTQQGAHLARFQCSSLVACFDVSPRLDYMVCECDDGKIHMWSLNTGKLVWERPAIIRKSYSTGTFRRSPSSPVFSVYRSVVFHPTADVVLPGVLTHAYDFNGDLKPLFLESNCNFTVCSILGHKAMMLTDCPDDARCIVIWSLKDGSEIRRISTADEVLSFAWSRDGRLLAVSHCTGVISFIDVTGGFRTLGQTVAPRICGMIKFSPNCGTLFCCHLSLSDLKESLFRLKFNITDSTFRLDSVESYIPWDLESSSEGGFMLGDPLSSSFDNSSLAYFDWKFDFVLNQETVLRSCPRDVSVDMFNINETRGTEKEFEGPFTCIKQSEFSLSGETIYIVSHDTCKIPTVSAWDVTNGKFIAKKNILLDKSMRYLERSLSYIAVVQEGIVLSPRYGTLELWNFELSKCFRRWTQLSKIRQIISISAEQVACECNDGRTEAGIVLDTSRGKIVSKIQTDGSDFVACNSKCQMLTYRRYRREHLLQLYDGSTSVWITDLFHQLSFRMMPSCWIPPGLFSPAEQFVVTWSRNEMLVLDAVSGTTLHILCRNDRVSDCKFVSDEECVVSSERGYSLRLFSVMSGHLLSIINLEGKVQHLAACPRTRLLAINQRYPKHGFKLVQVQLVQDRGSRESKR